MVLNHLQASFSGKDGCLRGRAATWAGDGCAPQKACNPCAGVRVQHGMSTIPGGVRFGRSKTKGNTTARNNPKITGKTFGPGGFLSGISKAFGPVAFQATVKAEVQTGNISKLVAFKAAPSKFGVVHFYTASERLTVARPQRDIRPVAAFGEVC